VLVDQLNRFLIACVKLSVESEVTDDQVLVAIVVKVTMHDPGPKPFQRPVKVTAGRLFQCLSVAIDKHFNGHEFAGKHEVWPSVIVDVYPLGIRYHPDL